MRSNCLLDIFVRFGNTVFRQIIGIPMGTNCAPLFFYTVMNLNLWPISKDPSKHSLVSL